MPNPVSLRRTASAALLAAPTLVVACGARGPLDIVVVQEQGDAGEAAPDAPVGEPDVSLGGGPPGFDAGGLINCGECLVQKCGPQFLACIISTPCRTTLQCAATTCLAGGMPDPLCVAQCANGDQQLLIQLGALFLCVSDGCGKQCTNALGGLGGGTGGGSG
jgi:hypothetical protein